MEEIETPVPFFFRVPTNAEEDVSHLEMKVPAVVSHLVWALETEAGLLEMEQVFSSTEQSL